MNAFRWLVTGLIVLLAGGYLVLFILASNFRRSFGASDTNALAQRLAAKVKDSVKP